MIRRVHARGQDIRTFILSKVEAHPSDISKITANAFGITRQAVNKHLQNLISEHALTETGKTRNRIYKLCALENWQGVYTINGQLAEDVVWTKDVKKALGELPDNVMNIWHHGFTEMFNNAIDHSDGTSIVVTIRRNAVNAEMLIYDDGVGIFKKIQGAMGLLDERHALLELSKGKLTTDPANHSGEGIFFTSRMFDMFDILSGGVYFSHEYGKELDWLAEREKPERGTLVWLKLNNHTSRTTRKIFFMFSTADDDYRFNKTIVPVRLARYGNDQLISRSQAKRLVSRIELFTVVWFDFKDVPSIGQAFADEIFRVFANKHPEIELRAIRASPEVKKMVDRAQSGPIKAS